MGSSQKPEAKSGAVTCRLLVDVLFRFEPLDLPIEGGDFLPGCGAIVQAVGVAAGTEPVIVGKPQPPLFLIALERLGLAPVEAAMVGDSVASDIRGGHAVGMPTVLYAPNGAADSASCARPATSASTSARPRGNVSAMYTTSAGRNSNRTPPSHQSVGTRACSEAAIRIPVMVISAVMSS